jgi:hypothetical protein
MNLIFFGFLYTLFTFLCGVLFYFGRILGSYCFSHPIYVLESHLLLKSVTSIEKALEESRKIIWVDSKCLQTRQARIEPTDDSATDLLRSEQQVASACKGKLESSLGATKNLLAKLKAARTHLAAVIRQESSSLGLTSESGFQIGACMLNPTQFPIVGTLTSLVSDGAAQRESIITLIADCASALEQAHREVQASLRDAARAQAALEVHPLSFLNFLVSFGHYKC